MRKWKRARVLRSAEEGGREQPAVSDREVRVGPLGICMCEQMLEHVAGARWIPGETGVEEERLAVHRL